MAVRDLMGEPIEGDGLGTKFQPSDESFREKLMLGGYLVLVLLSLPLLTFGVAGCAAYLALLSVSSLLLAALWDSFGHRWVRMSGGYCGRHYFSDWKCADCGKVQRRIFNSQSESY